MIFYDTNKKRKLYVRAGVFILLAAFIVLSVDTARGIYASGHTPLGPSEIYRAYDTYYNSENNDKKIALTFDDGPHPEYTREITNILQEKNVPATFFFVGEHVAQHKDIVREVGKAGFEIGNHTYTHAQTVHSSGSRLKWELDVTNKLIEDVTGKSALLYRPPYLLDIGTYPTLTPYDTLDNTLHQVVEHGYIPVGADIDSKDWRSESPEALIAKVEEEMLAHPDAHIILLHDGGKGADRSNTIDALPGLIDSLRADGYTFVTMSELFELDESMVSPAVSGSLISYGAVQGMFLSSILSFDSTLMTLFNIILGLIALRLAFLLALFAMRVFRKKKEHAPYRKLVSIVIPAYNEEANIESTIESVLSNNYQKKEVIVVDDGSRDSTAQVVAAVKEKYPGQIRIFTVENGGKARALDIGFREARGGVIVALDGDTIFAPDTISKLAQHFTDPRVGAVAGKVSVGNANGPLEIFQSLEYVVGQNIEKWVLATVGAVNVVPGAVGAWRKSAVLESGGHGTDTLVEDQDVTLSVLSNKWDVVYEPDAVAYTETPHTVRDFMRQRFRWVFGTMQCFWKYRRSLFSPKKAKLGWVILPNVLIYHIIIPFFSPIIDILALASLFMGFGEHILIAYLVFTLFDFAYTLVAYLPERGKFYQLALLPVQRIFYRQMIYFVILRGLIKAIEGTGAQWGKVQKRGVAKVFYEQQSGAKGRYATS